MWSFLKQPGEHKKEEKKKENEKKDEAKEGRSAGKSRSFLASWKMNREWLRNEGGVMFCQVCREEGNTASEKVNPGLPAGQK